jgi:hypothetical protein
MQIRLSSAQYRCTRQWGGNEKLFVVMLGWWSLALATCGECLVLLYRNVQMTPSSTRPHMHRASSGMPSPLEQCVSETCAQGSCPSRARGSAPWSSSRTGRRCTPVRRSSVPVSALSLDAGLFAIIEPLENPILWDFSLRRVSVRLLSHEKPRTLRRTFP